MKIRLLLLILCCGLFLQGYEYKYNVEPLDATTNAAKRNTLGIMYMEMGQYSAAMSEFKIAIMLSPNAPTSAAYYNNLGLLCEKLNMMTEAQESFEKAIKLNPVFLEY
ncbi:MAG: tetratricopeptide repeat protein, partial [Candidatus Gastranaerophilales bacterium]|nr:tetratricopeptide repeat protein [Candidatus Gastranaerophilales bacterium]